MNTNLFQLVGVYGNNLALYKVPNGLNAQECFNEAFEELGDDLTLDDVDDYVEAEFAIERFWVEEINTNKL